MKGQGQCTHDRDEASEGNGGEGEKSEKGDWLMLDGCGSSICFRKNVLSWLLLYHQDP